MTVLWGSVDSEHEPHVFSPQMKSPSVSVVIWSIFALSALVFKVIAFLFCGFFGVVIIDLIRAFNVYSVVTCCSRKLSENCPLPSLARNILTGI